MLFVGLHFLYLVLVAVGSNVYSVEVVCFWLFWRYDLENSTGLPVKVADTGMWVLGMGSGAGCVMFGVEVEYKVWSVKCAGGV